MFQYKPLLPIVLRILTCAFLIFAPNSLSGEEQVWRTDPPSPEALKDLTDWYGSYFQNNKCGWARITRKKIKKDTRERFIFEMESTKAASPSSSPHLDILAFLKCNITVRWAI